MALEANKSLQKIVIVSNQKKADFEEAVYKQFERSVMLGL
jgi:hypothetical protein